MASIAPGCCCGECVYYLYKCSDDSLTTFYATSASTGGVIGEGFGALYNGHCYYYGPCVPNTGGTEVSPELSNLFPACAYCTEPPQTFDCNADLGGALTDEQIEALYPDVRANLTGVKLCQCYVSPSTPPDSTQRNGTPNNRSVRLVRSAVARDGTGHEASYQYYSLNRQSPPSTGDIWVTGCTTYTTSGCPDCATWPYVANDVDYNEILFACRIRCQDTGAGNEWIYEAKNSAYTSINSECYQHTSAGAVSKGATITAGLLSTESNELTFGGNDCTTDSSLDPNTAPCGDGSLSFFAIPPGLP